MGDSLEREMVLAVERMTQMLVEFRQDVDRALRPLYQRVVETERRHNRIEQRLDSDAKERVERQQQLDATLAALHQTLAELQVHVLKLRQRSRQRLMLEIGTFALCLLLIGFLIGRAYL